MKCGTRVTSLVSDSIAIFSFFSPALQLLLLLSHFFYIPPPLGEGAFKLYCGNLIGRKLSTIFTGDLLPFLLFLCVCEYANKVSLSWAHSTHNDYVRFPRHSIANMCQKLFSKRDDDDEGWRGKEGWGSEIYIGNAESMENQMQIKLSSSVFKKYGRNWICRSWFLPDLLLMKFNFCTILLNFERMWNQI